MIATEAQIQDPIPGATKETGKAPNAAALDPQRSKKALWAGRILSGLAVLFLLFDATIKVLALPVAVEATKQLGYPEGVVFGLGIVELVCLVAYLVPRTAVLGAVLWTGYLSGAVASNVRLGNPLFSHILFPLYVAAFLWAGLWLRDRRLRTALSSKSI